MLQRLTLLILLLWCNALEAQNRELLGEYKFGFVGRDQEDAIYQAAREGAQAAALELNEKYSIDIELVIFTPDKTRGGSQMTSLAELFIADADGLIISPENTEAVRASIDFALQQGQEVVFFESQLSDRETITSVLADEVEAGRLAGRAILAKLPTKARVAILTSDTPGAELEQRMTGLREVLSYRRIETTITCAPDYLSAIEAIRAAEEADRNDQIKGWVFSKIGHCSVCQHSHGSPVNYPSSPFNPHLLPLCMSIKATSMRLLSTLTMIGDIRASRP